jgi:hypothetical protein
MSRFILIGLVFITLSCKPSTPIYESDLADTTYAHLIHQLNKSLIGVVSEDLFPPPVASRIYAYTNIAAFEAARQLSGQASLNGTLNDMPAIEIDTAKEIYWEVAVISSFCETAKHLVYRDHLIDSTFNSIIDTLKVNYQDASSFSNSLDAGKEIAKIITNWADEDGYHSTRSMPRYEPLKEEHAWEATAPTYGEALEPHWSKLRPFVMDSASQFRVNMILEFSKEKGSPFYAAAEEVYNIVGGAVPTDIEVAVYWDCNPGPTMVDGHLMQVRKQNTPGGHWVGIHSIIAQKGNTSLSQSCATYAKLCVGIADAFIAAWDTKFYHNLIRPETYINRYIDKDWQPKLESPLFPEYTSAHSLVSATAASILDNTYGEVAFFDDTNVAFGLPPRQFPNVWVAAEEAARSRLLGGIHYVFGCEQGFEQGKRLGQLVNQRIP